MNEEKIYYVYEWIRLDTNEPFYVGKGKEGRAYRKNRGNNRHFNNIVNKLPTAVYILHNNLTELEALEYEIYYIDYYKNKIGFDLVNITNGGEGVSGLKHTDYNKKKYSLMFTGIDIEKEKENIINLYENNNMSMIEIGKIYNISKTTIKRYLQLWGVKIKTNSESKKGKYSGTDSFQYGKKLSDETKKKISENHIGVNIGKDNPASVYVELYDEFYKLIAVFDTQVECAKYLVSIGIANTIKGAIDRIYNSIKKNSPYKGYYFNKKNNQKSA